MKIYIIILFYIPILILAKPSLVLEVNSTSNIPTEFKESVSMLLEDSYNYEIISSLETSDFGIDLGKKSLKCRKINCYIKYGKELNADFLMDISVESVNSVYSKKYKFKVSLVNLKSGLSEGNKLFFYKERLSNISVLTAFSKKLVTDFFLAVDKDKARKELEELKKIPKILTKKDIISMIKAVYPDVKACGKTNKFSGLIKVHFKVNNNGTTSDLKFLSEITDDLRICLVKVLNRMKPKIFRGDAMNITFPLKLD